MFTGIIETTGTVLHISTEGSNRTFRVQSSISHELKIDQSLSHDGVCLTVVALADDWHEVTAIEETLNRTQVSTWQVGSVLNLERAMRADARLDGHIVQGHVDATGKIAQIEDKNGSWEITILYPPTKSHLLVDKGSICLNGVSLTVINPTQEQFKVAIIPYTWLHTHFQNLQEGQIVNLEFDIIGKFVARLSAAYY